MLKKIDAFLRLLPFNGDKLKLSGFFVLIAQLPLLVPGLDFKEIILAVIENPTRAGIIAALVAAFHKIIKANLGDREGI